ncbi:FMN-binding negative transcriptional regulator [Variovorax sp. M-6]|uniref:FMN-binding negative transcriptional regulator n=1 Tax=Variovorax sp. M-6 TaxID=3233041 RepID=UPI003F9E66B5
MHTQPLFAMTERQALHQVMRSYPLATLITAATGTVEVNLLPLELSDHGPHGRLSGHVARTHSLWTTACSPGFEATVVFQSPNAYISPRWYVNGQRSGRNAPSWNYVAVQARGSLRFIEEAGWMAAHLASLTATQEAARAEPWSVDDAAPGFLTETARRLVGFEIEIRELAGKRFLSQQRTEADRQSLVHHLSLEASPAARAVATLIRP